MVHSAAHRIETYKVWWSPPVRLVVVTGARAISLVEAMVSMALVAASSRLAPLQGLYAFCPRPILSIIVMILCCGVPFTARAVCHVCFSLSQSRLHEPVLQPRGQRHSRYITATTQRTTPNTLLTIINDGETTHNHCYPSADYVIATR